MKRHYWLYGILLFALFGVLDTGYLTSIAFSGDPLTCNFLKGCDVVTTSPYSRIFGVPLSLFGLFFYLIAGGLAVWLLKKPSDIPKKALLTVSVFGVAASAYFLYLQGFVINAWCEYCLFSALMSVLMFIFALGYMGAVPGTRPEISVEKNDSVKS